MEDKSINEFMATPEWVDEHAKKGLLANQTPREITVRGSRVFVIDKVALDEAVKASLEAGKGKTDVRGK